MTTEVLPSSLAGFKPTPSEKDAYLTFFKQADTESLGVLTGDLAVPFFSHSSLPLSILGEIWQVSDPDNSGFLTPTRFGIACRLIGHAQAIGGQGDLNPDWVQTPGPKPKFNDPTLSSGPSSPPTSPGPQYKIAPQTTGASRLVSQTTGQTSHQGVLISPEERAKYSRLFAASGPVGGVLDGDKAKEIFVKSRLPFDTLGQIWNLADTRGRGSLDAADFTLGMYLIQQTMNGTLTTLPTVLDPKLYASAIGPPPPTPVKSSFSKPAPPPPHHQPVVAQVPWIITATEKAESDGYFASLVGNDEVVDGEKAVGFFSMSGLPIDILAKVWDLADIRGSGALNRDEFAVALKIIRDRVAGKEVPTTLSTEMIPPSLRSSAPAPAPVQSQYQRDLLDLDEDDEPLATSFSPHHTGSGFSAASTSTPLYAQHTGSTVLTPQPRSSSILSPQRTGGALAPQRTGQLAPQSTGASYTSSGFGNQAARTLSPQSTGFGNNFATSPQPLPQATATSHNFFDENDDADLSAKLAGDNNQLATVEREHAAVSASVTRLKQTRTELESSLSSTTAALNELQVKLSTARAAYETERAMVDDLQIRQKEQAALLARQRTELITAESDLSGLRVEKSEIEGSFLRDKEDVREMKRKMAEIAVATNELREVLEKVKKDARQQKGLVAISKKQLASAEGEREKLTGEIEAEMQKASAPVEEVEEESPFDHSATSSSPFDHPTIAAASVSLPLSPPSASPATSVRSTNPFDRLGLSPQATGTRSPSSPAVTSPLAVAGAIGAGVAAIGAGVVSVLGLGGAEKKEEETLPEVNKEEGPFISEAGPPTPPKIKEEETDPFGFPAGASAFVAPSFDSSDPFGVSGANAGGFDDFDQGFGDDFSALKIDSTPAVVGSSSTAFDDAFAELDATPTAVPAVIEAPVEVSVEAPFEEPKPIEAEPQKEPEVEEKPQEVEKIEEASIPVKEEVATVEVAAEEPFDEPPSAHVEELAADVASVDSSDDEDVIEDAGPSLRGRDYSESSPAVGTSTSDSGESFVHVPSATDTKFPALETLDEPMPSSVPEEAKDVPTSLSPSTTGPSHFLEGSNTPGSELDNFESATSSVVDPSPTASAFSDGTTSAPFKKRAAPPPPPRAVLPPPIAAPWGDSVPSSSNEVKSTTSPFDEFDDSAFSDLPPPAPVAAGSANFASPDFDTFDEDDDFSFRPEFEEESKPPTAVDEASFADFDSAFDPVPRKEGSSNTEPGFSFDDAFGEITSEPMALADSLGAGTTAPPVPTPALDDDVDGVKQIVGMGFSRSQAIDALEKYNYDVGRAINSMLG